MLKPPYSQEYFPHWTQIPVRFRDLDPLNHVNNAIFCTYYEEARINFIREIPELSAQLNNGFSFVLANLNIDFIKPVVYPAVLLIGSGIKSIGNSSITSFQAIYTEGSKQLISVAKTSGVWFDLNTQRSSRIPKVSNIEDFIVSS